MIDSPRDALWVYERAYEQSVAESHGSSDTSHDALMPWEKIQVVPESERLHYPALIEHYQQQGAPCSAAHVLEYLRGVR